MFDDTHSTRLTIIELHYEQAFLLLSDQNITWKRDREDALLLALRGGGKGYDPIVYGSDDCIMIEELDDDDSLSLC